MASESDAKRLEVAAVQLLRVETEVRTWIEKELGTSLPCGNLFDSIGDGVVLCELVEKLTGEEVTSKGRARSASHDATGGATPFRMLDNVTQFVRACRRAGVKDTFIFDPPAVQERKNAFLVANCLRALARTTRGKDVASIVSVEHLRLSRAQVDDAVKTLQENQSAAEELIKEAEAAKDSNKEFKVDIIEMDAIEEDQNEPAAEPEESSAPAPADADTDAATATENSGDAVLADTEEDASAASQPDPVVGAPAEPTSGDAQPSEFVEDAAVEEQLNEPAAPAGAAGDDAAAVAEQQVVPESSHAGQDGVLGVLGDEVAPEPTPPLDTGVAAAAAGGDSTMSVIQDQLVHEEAKKTGRQSHLRRVLSSTSSSDVEAANWPALAEWRSRHEATLTERETREEERLAEIKKKAAAEREQFLSDRKAKNEKSHSAHAAAEKRTREELDTVLHSDNMWERVCALIDMSAKKSERMRKVIIQVKNTPVKPRQNPNK